MPDNTLAAAQEQDGNREEAEDDKHKDDARTAGSYRRRGAHVAVLTELLRLASQS